MSQQQSCLIIAGEKSGEEHCLSFFDKLRERLPSCHFWGVGGDELKKKNMELIYHLNDFSSWGISEVIHKIPFYYKALDRIVAETQKRDCRIAILIDFQSFNLKLATKLKERGVHVLYYVAPQAWVWKQWRTKVLARTVDTLFTIIPFEKKWFFERGVKQVVSIDHPLYRHYSNELSYERNPKNIKKEFELLILPGSRNAEVKNLLPCFAEAARMLKQDYNVTLSIVCSSSINENLFKPYLPLFDNVYSNEELVEAMKQADLCLAASGTVTLSTAFFQLPTVVSYRSSLLNEWIYRTFIKYEWFFSLANIVHNKQVFPELLQEEVSSYNLVQHLKKWIDSPECYCSLVEELSYTKKLIRGELEDVPAYISQAIESCYE